MDNKSKILSITKTLTNDIYSSDSELEEIIDLVANEIMVETRIVKKLYQIVIFDTEEFYDLKSNAYLQDEIEEQVTGRVITGLNVGSSQEEDVANVIDLMTGRKDFIKPTIEFSTAKLYDDTGSDSTFKRNEFIAIDDIFNSNIRSVMENFEIIDGHRYKVLDHSFLNGEEELTCFYIASVVSDINNLDPAVFASLIPVIVQGVKFYLYNDPVTKESDNANNLHAMRYFKAKENLINQYPQKITTKRRTTRWL